MGACECDKMFMWRWRQKSSCQLVSVTCASLLYSVAIHIAHLWLKVPTHKSRSAFKLWSSLWESASHARRLPGLPLLLRLSLGSSRLRQLGMQHPPCCGLHCACACSVRCTCRWVQFPCCSCARCGGCRANSVLRCSCAGRSATQYVCLSRQRLPMHTSRSPGAPRVKIRDEGPCPRA